MGLSILCRRVGLGGLWHERSVGMLGMFVRVSCCNSCCDRVRLVRSRDGYR